MQIWRVSDGQLLHSFQSNEDPKMRTGFIGLTPDGKTLVTKAGKTDYSSPDHTPSHTSQIDVWDLDNKTKRYTLSGSYGQVNISPDGKLLAICSRNEPLALYRLIDGTFIRQLEATSKSCFQPQFSFNGKLLAILSYYPKGNPNKSIHVYDTENGDLKNILRARTGFYQEKEGLKNVVFSPDSRYLAATYEVRSSGSDFFVGWGQSYPLTSHGRIRLWRMEDGKQLQTSRGHRKGSSALVFSPSGDFLASTGRDNTIRFWKIPPRNYSWLWLLGVTGLATIIYWQRAYFIDLINW